MVKAGCQQAASPAIAVPVSLAACHAAWLKARRGKRPSANQMAFEARWLDRLLALKTALRAGCWQPARTVSFVVTHPKTREIHAPDFADRVVHHLLVERLEKLFEPIFIHDSYANRQGKGSHAAVDRLQQFMRSRNGQGWYLQLDIHNYFNSINRHTLYRMLCHRLEQCELRGYNPVNSITRHSGFCRNDGIVETCRMDTRSASTFRCTPEYDAAQAHPAFLALRSLCHKLLAHKVTEWVRDPEAAAQVPPHKRLANAAPGCGLPVGNLTSQFFANVYLNALDQFVKHTLKCRHYVRYVDDFILLADDAAQLRRWQAQIDEFLANTLSLKCKEAAVMQPLCQGIDFLGYRVFADHRRVRPRVVAHCRSKLESWAARYVHSGRVGTLFNADFRRSGFILTPPLSCRAESRPTSPLGHDALAHLQAMLGSYWGHFAHAQSVRLRRALFEQFAWLKMLFVLRPDGQLSPRWILQATTFAGQVAALRAEWPQAQCLIQKGNRWLLLAQPGLEFNAQAADRLKASLRRQQIAYVCANQTGWLRHGTRRREVREWFSPAEAAPN